MLGNNNMNIKGKESTSRNMITVYAVIGLGLCFRVLSTFIADNYIHNYQLPVCFFAFAITLFATGYFFVLQKPWIGRHIARKQWIRICVNSILLAMTLWTWLHGLRSVGTLSALVLEPVHIALRYIIGMGSGMKRKSQNSSTIYGVVVVIIASLLLIWSTASCDQQQQLRSSLPVSHCDHGGTWSVLGGTVLIILSNVISQFRSKFAKQLASDVSGPKRIHAISTAGACLLFLPIAFLQWLNADPRAPSFITLGSMGSYMFAGVFLLVSRYYLNSVNRFNESKRNSVVMDLFISFGFAALVDMLFSIGQLAYSTIFVFMLSTIGLYMMSYSSSSSSSSGTRGGLSSDDSSMISSSSSGGGDKKKDMYGNSKRYYNHGSMIAISRRVMRHILEDKSSKKIFCFLCMNLGFMFVELFVGLATNSLGLISDAGHMLFDCTALAIGLAASYISKFKSDDVFSYGYIRTEVVSGFVNAIFLVFVAISVLLEAMERIMEPPEIHTDHLLLVSVVGFLINVIGLFFFHDEGGHGHSHGGGGHGHGGGNENMRGVFLHVLADTLGSVGVIISTLLIQAYGWYLSDPIVALFISTLIFLSVIPLVESTATVLLQRVPESHETVLEYLLGEVSSLDGVLGVRDPHIWKLAGNDLVGSLHVQVTTEIEEQTVLTKIQSLFEDWGIKTLTVQIEKESFVTSVPRESMRGSALTFPRSMFKPASTGPTGTTGGCTGGERGGHGHSHDVHSNSNNNVHVHSNEPTSSKNEDRHNHGHSHSGGGGSSSSSSSSSSNDLNGTKSLQHSSNGHGHHSRGGHKGTADHGHSHGSSSCSGGDESHKTTLAVSNSAANSSNRSRAHGHGHTHAVGEDEAGIEDHHVPSSSSSNNRVTAAAVVVVEDNNDTGVVSTEEVEVVVVPVVVDVSSSSSSSSGGNEDHNGSSSSSGAHQRYNHGHSHS